MTRNKALIKSYICNCIAKTLEGDLGNGSLSIYDEPLIDADLAESLIDDLIAEFDRRGARWNNYLKALKS